MRVRSLGLVALVLCAAGGRARADSNDFTLERIVGMPPDQNPVDIKDIPRQAAYKSLMSEMGVVMAPRFLAPADTLGYSGFQVSFETSFTEISDKADYWKKGVENVSGGFLPTISVFARKGIWLPLPAFEVGAGVSKLIGANLYALQAYAKFALHEGFHDWPIPSFAVRGAVSRMAGSPQVDLTVVSIDGSVSKSFGVAGTFKLEPYLGAGALLIFARGQVIDTTPNIDAYQQGPSGLDLNANTTFPDPDMMVRWRFFVGMKVQYSILALTADLAYAFCNDSAMDCGATSTTHVNDLSGHQAQINFSGSLVF